VRVCVCVALLIRLSTLVSSNKTGAQQSGGRPAGRIVSPARVAAGATQSAPAAQTKTRRPHTSTGGGRAWAPEASPNGRARPLATRRRPARSFTCLIDERARVLAPALPTWPLGHLAPSPSGRRQSAGGKANRAQRREPRLRGRQLHKCWPLSLSKGRQSPANELIKLAQISPSSSSSRSSSRRSALELVACPAWP